MVLLAKPSGEFPLNDDWSYSRPVKTLVEQGRLELTGFTSMPLVAQVLWGALFCLPFGFSFTALRISTITLGLLGILATYWLFEELKADRWITLLSTMVVAVNPLYFLLSLTFMTDVPFFTFSMLAFLFLLRALRTESESNLLVGFAFSLVAILIRQLAIVIPLSFLVAYFVKHRIGTQTLRRALIPAAAFAILLFVLPVVFRRTIGLPALYNRAFEPIQEAAPVGSLQIVLVFASRLLVELIYLGLFVLPFSIVLAIIIQQGSSPQVRRLSIFAVSIITAVVFGLLLWQSRIMPMSGNVLFDFGLGPALLRDTYLSKLPHWPKAPKGFWLLVTAAAVLGSVLLVRHLWAAISRMIKPLNSGPKVERARFIFLIAALVFYSVLIGITGFLDRYLIWPLPLLMGAILLPRNSIHLRAPALPLIIAVTLIALYGFFALAGTHDYLAWNRARWQALINLMERDGLSYKNIDGGFEFNGWYGYNAEYRIQPSKSVWWVEDDDYLISFGPVPGYDEIRQYPFQRWMPFGQGQIMVLQRFGVSVQK